MGNIHLQKRPTEIKYKIYFKTNYNNCTLFRISEMDDEHI